MVDLWQDQADPVSSLAGLSHAALDAAPALGQSGREALPQQQCHGADALPSQQQPGLPAAALPLSLIAAELPQQHRHAQLPEQQNSDAAQEANLVSLLPTTQQQLTPPWKSSLAAPFRQCLEPRAGISPTQQYLGPQAFDPRTAATVVDPRTNSVLNLTSQPLPGPLTVLQQVC